MLNPYFLNNSKQEQNLIQSLVNEQLQMYGIEIYYIPRRYVKKNTVIREVIQSEFENAYPIEAYLDSYEGYGGQGTLLSKFGIEEQDDLTLVVSRERYENYISPLIQNIPNIELSTRPKEGDLIYFPLGDRLFEINYVEHEQPFYQLQKNYVYTLKCQLYRYEDEVLNTGVETIDDEIEQIGYIQKLQLIGVASGATASVNGICPGALTGIKVTNIGAGYDSVPTVAISSAPSGGIDAKAVAILTNDFVGCDGTKGGTILQVQLTNPGCGYTDIPTITISGGGGDHATAEVIGIETVGGIKNISINSGGNGYVGAPTVGISTPTHVGAAATATIGIPTSAGAGASVIDTHISVGVATYLFPGGTTGGVFFKSAPTVTFSTPTGGGNNATATGIATIRFNSISTTGTLSTTSTLITGVTTEGILVGDRVRLSVGSTELYNFIPEATFVSGIGAGSITLNQASTNVGIATSVFEFGIDQCGIVTDINITYGGGGYLSPPTVTISNDPIFKNYVDIQPGVTTAVGVAHTNDAGVVTGINIIDSGSQYVLTPTVTISEPVNSSTGSFEFNEIVTGETSGTTARVKQYDAVNNILEVSIVDGTFTPGETIIGSESGAKHTMKTQEKFDTVDPFADNDVIQFRSDDIIDFSKRNPFGMP